MLKNKDLLGVAMYLMDHQHRWLSKSQIVKGSGAHWNTVTVCLNRLDLQGKLLEKSGCGIFSVLYKYNNGD